MFRSASGPGLSINTSSANNLFGSSSAQTTKPPETGSLFGSAATTKPASLFGSTATSAPTSQGLLTVPAANQPSGGLFGQTSNPAPAQTGGIFGAGANTSQAPSSGGLFGSLNTSQAPASGGLFGATAANPQAPQTGGLFGSSTTANQPQQSTSLFGATQTPRTGGLFGQASQTSGTGGLFGSTAAQQPAQTGGLFGGLNQPKPATGSLFGSLNTAQNTQTPTQQSAGPFAGGLKLGQSQTNQSQQTIPGVRIDLSQIRGTTRFNDLQEDIQKELESADQIILALQARSGDINAILASHGEQLSFIPDNATFLSRKLLGVETAHEADAEAVSQLQRSVKTDAQNAQLSFKVIHNQRQPQPYQQNGTGQDLVAFFAQAADEMAATLTGYQNAISEIESHLRNVETSTILQTQALNGSNSSNGAADEQLRELTAVLREFEQGIIGVAGQVGTAREGVQQLQFGGYLDLGQSDSGSRNVHGKRSGIY